MARTIDNLGVDISTRYAEDQELFDATFIKESRSIPSQASISVTLPFNPSEFELLFELNKRGKRWANFIPPANYHAQRRRLFAEQLIPDLGTLDKQEAQQQRLAAIGDEEKKKKREQNIPKEEEEIEIEKQILLTLLGKIHLYDTDLIEINSKRSQYQKG